MVTVIAATVLVLGTVLVGAGVAIRLGVVGLVPEFDPDPEMATKIKRGGMPVVLAGGLSLVAGAIQLSTPIPNVGWLGYTIAFLGLIFFGAARVGGA